MRVSREQAVVNRERVLDNASSLFREYGIDSVSIADVMKAAELTHGGFYKQFASKEALAEEACLRGLENSALAIYRAAKAAAEAGDNPLRRIASSYLSTEHRDLAGQGCTLAALASDAARGSAALQAVFAKGAIAMATALGEVTAAASWQDPATTQAGPDFVLMAQLIGAVILSRAVNDADPVLADRILTDMQKHVIP